MKKLRSKSIDIEKISPRYFRSEEINFEKYSLAQRTFGDFVGQIRTSVRGQRNWIELF